MKKEDIEREPSLSWLREHLGFVTDDHQMNVGITRARRGLCIIGRSRTLKALHWIHWIKYMKISASESIRKACFNLERLSRSSRLLPSRVFRPRVDLRTVLIQNANTANINIILGPKTYRDVQEKGPRSAASIYAHTPVRTCTADVWIPVIFSIKKKQQQHFLSLNRDDWCIFLFLH